MVTYLKKLIAGIVIGIANVVPGVSGGTIAVVFGVYTELIDLASLDIKKIKTNWKPLLFLSIGVGMGVIVFAKVFKILHSKFPAQINFFFIGLIIGSLFLIFKMVKERDAKKIKKSREVVKAVFFALGLALMFGLYLIRSPNKNSGSVLTELNLVNGLFLFLAGVTGAVAMLIPGISGSFILLVIGIYHTVIKAINDFNIAFLLLIGLGVLAGLVFGANLIKLLMAKYPKNTYAFILGLVSGSVFYLYPRVCRPFGTRIISVICLLAGYILINLFEKKETENDISK